MITKNGITQEPTLGERISISFAIFFVWLFGSVFVALFLFLGLPLAQQAPALFWGVGIAYVVAGIAVIAYVFMNPRRAKMPK